MRLGSSTREPGLDTLRAIAIVVVLLYHLMNYLPEALGSVGQYGWMGVDLFFVLSGYLIGAQIFRPYAAGERPSIWEFYRRRFFRILPAYLVVVALYAGFPSWREAPGFGPLWKFLTFTENLCFNPDFRAFSHVWSLCVEEHFYLVLPVLAMMLMRRPSARRTAFLLVGVMVCGILLRGYWIAHTDSFMRVIYYPTWMRLDGLLVGVTLALVRVFRPAWWERARQWGHATMLIGFVCVGFVVRLFRDDGMGETHGAGAWGMVAGLPLMAIGLGLVLASSVSRNGLLSRYKILGARAVATLAFTLYLTHKAIVHLDRTYVPALTAERDGRAMVVYAVSCLIAASLLHFCVERPFLLLRDRLDRPGRLATGAKLETRPSEAVEQPVLSGSSN